VHQFSNGIAQFSCSVDAAITASFNKMFLELQFVRRMSGEEKAINSQKKRGEKKKKRPKEEKASNGIITYQVAITVHKNQNERIALLEIH
jgi:hypothetical protein